MRKYTADMNEKIKRIPDKEFVEYDRVILFKGRYNRDVGLLSHLNTPMVFYCSQHISRLFLNINQVV